MSIVRRRRGESFAIVPNHIWDEQTRPAEGGQPERALSFLAKGLLAYLLGRPNEWTIHVEHLRTITGCGRNKVYELINELIDFGYAQRLQTHDNVSGKFGATQIVIFDEPVSENRDAVIEPFPQNRDTDTPFPGLPYPVNRDAVKEQKDNIPPKAPQPDLVAALTALMDVWPRFEAAHRGKAMDLFEALSPTDKAAMIVAGQRYPSECRAEAARRGRTLDQHVNYTKTLPKWIAERKWLGSEAVAALASPAAKRIAAGADVVVRNRGEAATPALFATCLELMGSSWAWKADWAEAIFPKDVVERARDQHHAGGGNRLSA